VLAALLGKDAPNLFTWGDFPADGRDPVITAEATTVWLATASALLPLEWLMKSRDIGPRFPPSKMPPIGG
jgi:hypothetical protein